MAEQMMYDQGFYKLSLAELTKKMCVSRSTIYENFGSKEGLVEQVIDRFSQRLNKGLQTVIEDETLDTVGKFIAVAQTQG